MVWNLRRDGHWPLFFEDELVQTTIVNQDRYCAVNRFFGADYSWKWHEILLVSTRCRTTSHSSYYNLSFLKSLFLGRLISKNWPPRSSDLTPPNFFLWSYLKSKVYINKPRTIEELKANIRREVAAISVETLANTMKNAEKLAHCASRVRGNRLRDIIFKNWCNQIFLNQIKWF